MAARLSAQQCEACDQPTQAATADEIATLHAEIPDWEIVEIDGVSQLQRTFKFRTFREALDFTNRVGQLAETENHHPTIETSWGRVRVWWWTHRVRGLHRNDFIMAAKTDELAAAPAGS